LRFRQEDIYAVREGPRARELPLPVPVLREKIQQDRLRYTKGRLERSGTASSGIGGGSADPSIDADAVRFGLRPLTLETVMVKHLIPSCARRGKKSLYL
jgi:hypothetical protein